MNGLKEGGEMENRDLNLTVGVGLQLEKIDDLTRYVVELLGYRVGEGVIITAPYDQDDQVPLAIGDEVIIRHLGGVSGQFAFRTMVVHMMSEPYPHVHLKYPGDIDATMMRRDIRVPVNETVTRMALDDMGNQLDIEMQNISRGGAMLVSPVELGMVGEEFTIEMPLLSEESTAVVTLNCAVRHVREKMESETASYHHGVEFVAMDTEAREYITDFIQLQSDKS